MRPHSYSALGACSIHGRETGSPPKTGRVRLSPVRTLAAKDDHRVSVIVAELAYRRDAD
ncbi:hypothetical protein BOSEA31B_12404 [Hyphomicrobiales bacterium]|nr:hypothetical protein BOSEA31B_12404 [Hyphomicrobiales bacterium]CAH1698184.1 hypothetical protein BOSEA1005_11229 [Hyphomicrobiales bacterium]CAI0347827.1 hypothetical protein BO1005MUT1_90188 [Hyphomicrobiales bacterium]